jgi:demethylmenaquinone methyltransferase/2-methoxy-6-polyprenyl-1,4-benzoquinol methylase
MPRITEQQDQQPGVLRVLQTKQEVRAFYNKIARVYDLLAEISEEPIRRLGLERLAIEKGERVLEVGFGTGSSLIQLAEQVGSDGKVFGVDIAEQMLKVAQQKLTGLPTSARVELACGDAENLPFVSDCFNAIFMSFTLELFDTPEIPAVLRECKRVLQPGGRLLVIGMSKEEEEGALIHIFEWTHKHFPNFLDCRPIFVRRALTAAGFEIISAERQSMWIPVEIVLGRRCDQER